jgi:hypothetical protein
VSYIETIRQLGYQSDAGRRDLICSQLDQATLDYTLQKGDYGVTNIIVPAKHRKGRKIVLCAHYDVFPGSSGYYDNGAALALLLDLAPGLAEEAHVEILFSDKEESGGLGVEHYLSTKGGRNIALAINLDIIGLPDTVYYSATSNCPSQATEVLNRASAQCVRYPFCDFNVFEFQNIPTLSIITTGAGDFRTQLARSYECMHCGKDDGRLELLDAKMIAHVGTLVRACPKRFLSMCFPSLAFKGLA